MSAPVREFHRATSNAWFLLGVAAFILAFPSPVRHFLMYARGGPLNGEDSIFVYQAWVDSLGCALALAIAIVAVRAKGREANMPVLPFWLTISTGLYLLERAAFVVVFVLGPELR